MPLLQTGVVADLDDEERNRSYPGWRQLRLSQSKLKAASNTSALLVGFAMVALVEFELRSPGNMEKLVGTWWLIVFGVCASLLISVHLIALIMSACILPHMVYINGEVASYEQPYSRFKLFVELAWVLSTVLGLLLFLVEITIMCLIKFRTIDNMAASYAMVAVLGPALVVFLCFTYYFYRTLHKHKIAQVAGRMRELERSYQSLQNICEKMDERLSRSSSMSTIWHEVSSRPVAVPIILVTAPKE